VADPSDQKLLVMNDRIALAKSYGVQFYRSSINKGDWYASKTGQMNVYDNLSANGFAILLNLVWSPTRDETTGLITQQTFPSNAASPSSPYYQWVKEVIDSVSTTNRTKPIMVVVENEENNEVFYDVSDTLQMNKYVDMLKAVLTICNPKGIYVTNGGFTSKGLQFATQDWLKNTVRRTAEAQSYAWNAFSFSAYYTLYPPRPAGISGEGVDNLKDRAFRVKYLLGKYQTMALACINFHWYEPTRVGRWDELKNNGTPWSYGISKNNTSLNVFETSMEFLVANSGGKKIITNELGVLTNSSCLVKEIMTKVAAKPFGAVELCCFYDGDGFEEYDARALHNTFSTMPTYTYRPSGDMFAKIVKRQAAGSCYAE
jgi:hypothetical protein